MEKEEEGSIKRCLWKGMYDDKNLLGKEEFSGLNGFVLSGKEIILY